MFVGAVGAQKEEEKKEKHGSRMLLWGKEDRVVLVSYYSRYLCDIPSLEVVLEGHHLARDPDLINGRSNVLDFPMFPARSSMYSTLLIRTESNDK